MLKLTLDLIFIIVGLRLGLIATITPTFLSTIYILWLVLLLILLCLISLDTMSIAS
jgi:hypothetical protein